MNRQQRRMAASNKKGAKKALQEAGLKLGTALDTLKEAGGLDLVIRTLTEVQTQVAETNQVLEAMVQDNQTMADLLEQHKAELALQREVTFRFFCRFANAGLTGLGPAPMEAQVRELEERTRAEVLKAAKESSCEGA